MRKKTKKRINIKVFLAELLFLKNIKQENGAFFHIRISLPY